MTHEEIEELAAICGPSLKIESKQAGQFEFVCYKIADTFALFAWLREHGFRTKQVGPFVDQAGILRERDTSRIRVLAERVTAGEPDTICEEVRIGARQDPNSLQPVEQEFHRIALGDTFYFEGEKYQKYDDRRATLVPILKTGEEGSFETKQVSIFLPDDKVRVPADLG